MKALNRPVIGTDMRTLNRYMVESADGRQQTLLTGRGINGQSGSFALPVE